MEAGSSSWNVKPVGGSRGWSRSIFLARAGTGKVHRGMNLSDLEALLRCRDCRCRRARLEPVARIPKQAFVGGMI